MNVGQTGINAVLTEDITINENVLDADGKLTGDTTKLRSWTPIYNYTGTFDGDGHTISGLYVNVSSGSYIYVYAGLFGYISGGTVKNLSIADSYIYGSTSTPCVGGVCGRNNGGTITNCYWLEGTAGTNGTGIGKGSGEATEKSEAEFASGEVAWLLNDTQTAGPWRQTLGENGDKFPTLDSTHREVVKLTVDEDYVSYRNSGFLFNGEPNKAYFNGDERVQVPCEVTADTTLTSKTLVTPSITGTASKVYDGTTSGPDGLSITLSGIDEADTVTATATFTYDNADVGTGKTITATGITLAGADAAKYVLSTDAVTAAVGEITTRTLTIIAEDKSANMGDAMPELTYKVDGLVGSDKLLEAPELTGVPDMTKAGEYPITVTGGSASENYTIVHVDGKLVVGVSYVVTVDGAVYYVLPKVGSFILPAAPSKPGYIFMGWSDGNNTFQPGDEVGLFGDTDFTSVWANMPDITSPEPDKPDELPFTDVPEDAWYYDAVYYVWANGLMEGVDENTFAPDSTLTRAMVWAVLARIDGVEISGSGWMTAAQDWAVANGISDGSDPTGAITREQLVTMLWRFAGEPVVNYLITAPRPRRRADKLLGARGHALGRLHRTHPGRRDRRAQPRR